MLSALPNVTTNVAGFATISATFTAPSVSPGALITATATDPDGNTSEDLAVRHLHGRGGAASFVVTNTNDSGAGSLRAAILGANANEGAETITFAIPGSGRHTITVRPRAPRDQRENTTIDGTSQSGFIGTPLIELAAGRHSPGSR